MGHPMTFGWRLVDRVCRLLERDDRDAVCGDLAESQMPAGRALREVVGLLLRRQAALWLDWGPWAGVTIALPLGFLLSVASRWFADGTAFHASLYSRTGDWAYLAIPGWRRDFLASAGTATLMWLALAAWSWTAGFALSRVSRRAWCSVSALFAMAVVLGTLTSTTTGTREGYAIAHFSPIGLYLTGVMRMLLVLLPALYGIDAARDVRRRSWSTVAIAVATVALTALSAKALEGSFTFGWGFMRPQPGPDGIVGTADDLRPLWWVSFVMAWPAVFVFTNTVSSRFRRAD